MSFSAMPPSFSAASTAVIFCAFALLASRAVAACVDTPMRKTAESGAALTVASPVTLTRRSMACAAPSEAAATIRHASNLRMQISLSQRHEHVHFELFRVGGRRIGRVFLERICQFIALGLREPGG